jgi:putative heme iron utilization protein
MHIPTTDLIHLLHETSWAVLATHSTQIPGFPFGTAVPLVVDEGQQPILLISALAEHTKNLLADSRASLALVESGKDNVQDARRATLLGHFRSFEPTQDFVCRYLRYQPDAERYLQLDFTFYRMDVEQVRYIGGIGKMGWLEAKNIAQAVQIIAADETALLSAFNSELPQRFQILGLDSYGIDFLADGFRDRLRFEAAMNRDALEAALPALRRRLN